MGDFAHKYRLPSSISLTPSVEEQYVSNSGADPGFVVKGGGGREYARGLGTLVGPGQNPYRERKLWGFEE